MIRPPESGCPARTSGASSRGPQARGAEPTVGAVAHLRPDAGRAGGCAAWSHIAPFRPFDRYAWGAWIDLVVQPSGGFRRHRGSWGAVLGIHLARSAGPEAESSSSQFADELEVRR